MHGRLMWTFWLCNMSNMWDISLLIPLLAFTSSISQTAPGPVNIPVFQPVRPLPSVQFQVERVNVEHSVPMYAPELISTVSSLSHPSDNLLHHCYAHLYLKVSMTVFYSNPNCPFCRQKNMHIANNATDSCAFNNNLSKLCHRSAKRVVSTL